MSGVEKYLEMLTQGGPAVFVGIGIFVAILIASVVFSIMRGKQKVNRSEWKQRTDEFNKWLGEVQVEERGRTNIQDKEKGAVPNLLGTGQFKAMVFRPGNILDFTTIPEPIGEMYQFDPSCPVSGLGYIVKQVPNGEIVDYDPREVRVKIDESPEHAWFATHWDIVSVVFSVVTPWWRSRATWYALGMMLIVFITALVVFD